MALRVAEKAALSDVGRQRQSNEDSYLERSPLFVVADGMGGARAGEVASQMAVDAFEGSQPEDKSPEQWLGQTVRGANRRIHDKAKSNSEHAGMGTTITAAFVTGREVAIAHVGDSRLYRMRDGSLERLTQDHSLVEEFVRQGKLTPEEAAVHPQRSIITRALGPEADVQVEAYTHVGRDGDVYLICSDGLTGMVSERELEEMLQGDSTLEQAAQSMIDEANRNGGKDNITVVLFRVEDDDPADDEHDTLGGQETVAGGVTADSVRAAVEDADAREPRREPEASGSTRTVAPAAAPDDGTLALSAAEADEARAAAAPPVPLTDERPSPPVPRRTHAPTSGRRKTVTALIGLLALAALIYGFVLFNNSQYFIGTDDDGQVTVFNGLPYELPFGVELYSEEFVSQVPAASISDRRLRNRILDHQLRTLGDATDVVRQLERTQGR